MEFWESSFQTKRAMWGFAPADSALATVELFQGKGLRKVLIPGFGYGRNAQVFADHGFAVTGIEISATAIALARQHYGDGIPIYHGRVQDMPYDQELYDGIFCHALIHLLDAAGRAKLIRDCHNQLSPGGYMAFVAISTTTATYGEGVALGKDWFETKHGVRLFYYDLESVNREFGAYGLIAAKEVDEPAHNLGDRPSQKFWHILCQG